MKVIHLACVAPPTIGGIGAVALREVVGLRGRGVDAQLVVPETGEPSAADDRSFIRRVKPLMRWGNGAFVPNVVSLVRGADLIHLHYPFFGAQEPLFLQAASLPPIVLTFHMDAATPGIVGLGITAHRMLLQPWMLGRVKRVLVSSFDYARTSSLAGFLARHPERVAELPFGVDTDFFRPGISARERFSVPDEADIILFVGGLDRAHGFKGMPELLRAAATLKPSTHVLIVGDGDMRAAYEALSAELGLRQRTHFLGKVDQPTLRDAYQSADVFAFPSVNAAESFGLAALEAEACGVPVVASDLPGVRTVVRQGETGLLVPPGDVAALASALSTILSDRTLRETMRDAARRHAESFSWDKHLDGLLEIYRALVL
jgi:glycosyltransferase involved in cell wall biosynthesis